MHLLAFFSENISKVRLSTKGTWAFSICILQQLPGWFFNVGSLMIMPMLYNATKQIYLYKNNQRPIFSSSTILNQKQGKFSKS